MTKNVWFISDTHFGHKNIIKFLDNQGKIIRPFSSIEEHDETIIQNWNKVVKPTDKVYHLGDVAMTQQAVALIDRCNGRKTLVAGNHDIYMSKWYMKFFDNIRSCKVYPDHGIIMSHFPAHSGQLEHRFKFNVHGHLHANHVTKRTIDFDEAFYNYETVKDERYLNICVEHTNYTPLSLEEIIEKLKN